MEQTYVIKLFPLYNHSACNAYKNLQTYLFHSSGWAPWWWGTSPYPAVGFSSLLVSAVLILSLLTDICSAAVTSNCLPPISTKLVKRVQEGFFIEMAKLSFNYLDSAELNTGKQIQSRTNPWGYLHNGMGPMFWHLQLCSNHLCSKSKHVADLIGYQSIITGAF